MSGDQTTSRRIGRNFLDLSGLTSPEITKFLASQTPIATATPGRSGLALLTQAHGIVESMKAAGDPLVGALREICTPLSSQLQSLSLNSSRPLRTGFEIPIANALQPFRATYLGTIRRSLQPLLNHDFFGGIERAMLPPNLREASHDIKATQVYDFLAEEGIPLYLVPRAPIAVRLLRAETHAARRKVLNDRHDAVVPIVWRC